jgi:hypothetical protein
MDMQHMDEPQRSKSPVHVFPFPIPESASPKVFDAELDRLADQPMSTTISYVSTITPTANAPTPKRSDDEWFVSHPSQHSTPTPRKGGKNFSRPAIIRDPNPSHLELPIEQDKHFERFDFGITPELISSGHVSTYGPSPINERQPQQSQQYGQKAQISSNTLIQAQAYNIPRAPHTDTKLRQEPYEIPHPQFSPYDTIPTLRGPHPNYSQRRISYQQSMQSQQQTYIPPQSVQASHGQVEEYPETFDLRQLEDDLEYERKQTYRQLSANDPSQYVQLEKQSFQAQGNSQGSTIRQVVYPVVSGSKQLETTSPMTSPLMSPTRSPMMSPTRSPMMSPARSPVINPVMDHSGHVGLPSRTETQQPVNNKKEDKRKSRTFLKRGKKDSIKAF